MSWRILHNLILVAAFSAGVAAAADPAPGSDIRFDADEPRNEYPSPGSPVPDKASLPADDTKFLLTPAPEFDVRAGYAGYGDNRGYDNGGGLGVVVFLEGGKTGVLLQGQVAGGQGGAFAYAEGDFKFRYRIPLDRRHIWWWGAGLNIDGRGASNPHVASYLSAQLPVAFIGTMFSIKGKCVIQLFAKAAFGIFDNQTQDPDRWGASLDTMVRPAVGGEALAQCGAVRVIGDYQHIFSFGDARGADKAQLQFSQTWPIKKLPIQIGYFGKGDFIREGPWSGAAVGDPRGDARNMGQILTGLEVRY